MTAPPAAPHSDLAALWPRLSLALFYALICAGLALLTLGIGLTGQQMQRGIWRAGDPLPPASAAPSPLGTTVDLLQYEEDAALDAALDSAEAMGLHWLRQELRWDLVEATAGQPRWAAYDRVIDAASAKGLEFDAVVLVEPAAIVDAWTHGARVLYVALTRAVQQLHIIHARPLPADLG